MVGLLLMEHGIGVLVILPVLVLVGREGSLVALPSDPEMVFGVLGLDVDLELALSVVPGLEVGLLLGQVVVLVVAYLDVVGMGPFVHFVVIVGFLNETE